MPRYNYANVIRSLADDDFIRRDAETMMLDMNSKFLSLRRRSKQITPDIVRQFENGETAS
jgi:hypothetical protein